MARRRLVEPSSEELDQQPPPELLRFKPSAPAPVGPFGRPEPWRLKWTAGEFAAWLRTRAAWRDTHSRPLPGLLARERYAMTAIPGISQALIDIERNASKSDSSTSKGNGASMIG